MSIKVSVRELVGYVYNSGDLNKITKQSVSRALIGSKIHRILQSSMGDNYHKEYFLKHSFFYNDIDFVVEGRADGIIINNNADYKVTVDEIKSTYDDVNNIGINYNITHIAQAKCYAYFYALQEKLTNICVQLRYCNIDTLDVKEHKYYCSFNELETFFYELMEVYLEWATVNTKHQINKIITSKDIQFPFEKYRKGQRDLLVAVYQTIKYKRRLFVQAPTGIGKTISVIFPTIKLLSKIKSAKIFYLTSKSSTKKIAEETLFILYEKGLKLRTTIITAKEKICFNDEFVCDAEKCPYAKNYYNKINKAMLEILRSNYMYNYNYIVEMSKKYMVCPFELSLQLSYVSDIVICDYNYYFDPRVAFQREDTLENNKDILLIDEAHNLEDRTRNMYSCELVKEDFYQVYKEIKSIENDDLKQISKTLNKLNKEFIMLKKTLIDKNMIVINEPSNLISKLGYFITKTEMWMNKNSDYSNEKLEEIYFKAMFFTRLSEICDDNYVYYISKKSDFRIKLMLINTSDVLKNILKKVYSTIFFSATLFPLKYYRQILGGDETDDKLISLESPFDENKFKLIVTGDISMKYNVRDLNINKVSDYIYEFVNIKNGNYIVFFPSYSYLRKIVECYTEKYDDNIIVNDKTMNEFEQVEILDKFNNNNVVLFTVVGGSFSEGVNLPMEKLIGAVVIGTGIPKLSFERDLIKKYFDNKYSCGFDFAYKYTGFNKILQSIGRIIRTEEDKGACLIIDSRLLGDGYQNLFPNHLKNFDIIYNKKQLVNILNIFWNN